jgi:hypothetical protein
VEKRKQERKKPERKGGKENYNGELIKNCEDLFQYQIRVLGGVHPRKNRR